MYRLACSKRAVHKPADFDVLKVPKDLAQQDWYMRLLRRELRVTIRGSSGRCWCPQRSAVLPFFIGAMLKYSGEQVDGVLGSVQQSYLKRLFDPTDIELWRLLNCNECEKSFAARKLFVAVCNLVQMTMHLSDIKGTSFGEL